MNAKTLTILILLIAMILSACASAAPTRVAQYQKPEEGRTVAVEKEVEKKDEQQAQKPSAEQARPLATAASAAPGVAAPPADNFFQDYGVNPYEDAREDHLSTFALDVDTASYTVARRYVMDGNLPPADAVRVEEFVNYFDQGYPTPEDIAFAVYADGAPSPFQSDGTVILRFGIQGYQVPESDRKSASLTFVIDISGSMDMENRLGLVKRSLELLVERLRTDDTVAIVVYGTDARVALYPTTGNDKQAILNAIYSLHTEGATNAEAGLTLGYEMAMKAYRPGANNRLILCSDGVANVGVTSPDTILRKVHGYVEEGITLTTVGFGMGNFNDVLMEQLADNGNGSYAYVDTLQEARKLFVDNLTSTLQVIALDAKVQVDFNTDVVSRYRLIGYENRAIADQDFRNDRVDAGEIGAGHSVTALYAVQLNPQAQGRIATIQLRWQDPDARQVREINGNFNTWDLSSSFETASPRYRLAVVVAQYAELLRQSPWARGASVERLMGYAEQISRQLPGDNDVREFADLVYRAAKLDFLREQ
jgi:Ca-activated chloride channel homolog